MGRLEGKVAFITGVARGQGRSHAIRLAEEGADIVGVDSLTDVDTTSYPMATQEDLDETTVLVEKTGRRASLSRADVRDRDGLKRAVLDGVAEFGRLDIVCANAGIMPIGRPLWEIPSEQWQDVIDVNLTGVFNTLAVTVPAMRATGNGGSIILTASAAALRFGLHLGDYSATRAGVVALAKTLANELAAEGIRVNAICPGAVATPMIMANEQLFTLFRPDLENPTLQDCEAAFSALMPMGGPWLAPEDVSNMVVFLASDEASSLQEPRCQSTRELSTGDRGVETMSATEPVVPLSNNDRFFIGGEWVKPSSDAVLDVIDSATERLYFQVPEAQPADMDLAIGAARRAFDRGPWPRMTHAERAKYSAGAWPTSSKHGPLTTAPCGHTNPVSCIRSRSAVKPATPRHCGYYADLADDYPFEEPFTPSATSMAGGGFGLLVREPVGVVGAIIPVERSLPLVLIKVAPALLAGCTVIVKVSPGGAECRVPDG